MLHRALCFVVLLLSSLTSVSLAQDDDARGVDDPTMSSSTTPPSSDDEGIQAPQQVMEVGYFLEEDVLLDGSVRRKLQDERYRFCQDPDYRLFQSEKDALCGDLSIYEGRCPKLEAACNRPPWEASMGEDADDSWFDWDLPGWDLSWVGMIFKIIFWTALAIGLFILVRSLVRQAMLWREERDLKVAPTPAPATMSDPDLEEELRAQVLFSMARRALDENRITEALHLTYRATIRTLSDAEWVKPHRSKTSGDYLKALIQKRSKWTLDTSARPPVEPGQSSPPTRDIPLDEVTTHLLELDRERFRANPRAPEANHLLGRAESLASRLGHVAAMCMSMWFVGCDPAVIPESPHEPRAPRGQQLFEDLLRERAYSVNRRLHRMVDVPPETVSVVSISASLRPIEWSTLSSWVKMGGHLVVANPNPEFLEEFGERFATTSCSGPLSAPNLELARLGEKEAFVSQPGGDPLVQCGKLTYATTISWDAGWVTVIADSSLFENASLAASDNASLAFHLVGNLQGHVELLGPWTGRGAQDPIQSITRAGFGWWVLHLLLMGLIFAWSRGKRMGPPVDPKQDSRRAFSEHAHALSRRYERAHASGFALQNYAEWVYDNLRKRAPSTRADLKSLTRAVSTSDREAAKLREALTSARRASELGETTKEHYTTFRRLKSAVLGISEVSRKKSSKKD